MSTASGSGPCVSSPTAELRSGREDERHAGALRDGAELRHQVVGHRHAVLEAIGARGHLRISWDEHGLVRIGALGPAQHVDDLIEILLELAVGAENPELAECALVRDLAFWLQLSSSWAYLRIYSGQSFKFA